MSGSVGDGEECIHVVHALDGEEWIGVAHAPEIASASMHLSR
jgi:hypothetical protein